MSEKLKILRQQYQENPSTLTSSQRGYLQRLGELSSEERKNAFETMPAHERNEAMKFFMENRRN